MTPQQKNRALAVLLAQAAITGLAFAQQAASAPVAPPDEETTVLSPFNVTTTSDQGYKATNSTSGTRIDTRIKDIPMPLEVITEQFVKDTGATTLRQALQYSAGIQLQSQNDYTGNGLSQYANPGGVNNPEMQTANKTDTTIVIRGFTTDNALRDGFRRKVTTDSVNISRIEVVRGPAALLYGIGNFGGVVNYVVKAPSFTKKETSMEMNFGSRSLKRGTFDTNLPLGKKMAFRLSGAVQENGDQTPYYNVKKWSIAPIFTFRPFEKTEITIDFEYGQNFTKGLGFQSIRARADALGNNGRQEHAGFIAFPGVSLRTMRWSGPDTYRDAYQGNLEIKLTQHLAEGLDLLIGYNGASVTFNSRDVNASATTNIGPQALWSTLIPVPLDATRGDTDASWAAAPIPRSIIAYNWQDTHEGNHSKQGRAELSYKLKAFDQKKWWGFDNTFLAGTSIERDRNTSHYYALDASNSVYNWKSAADATPFLYKTQGDGSPSLPLRKRQERDSLAKEFGVYGVYQGKFLKDMVTFLGGIRYDKNGVSTHQTGYRYADGTIDPGATNSFNPEQKSYRTNQIGVSFAPIKELSLFAMRSQGINPNFSGARDMTGKPMDAVIATDKEFGIKLDLLNGKISGTISHYSITREGQPNGSFWWGPQTATHRFDPTKPVVYNVTDLNPDAATKVFFKDNTGATVPLIQWSNNYAWWGDLNKFSSVPVGAQGNTANDTGLASYKGDGLNAMRDAIVNTWNAAKTAGAVKYWDKGGASISESSFVSTIAAQGTGSAFTTIVASTPQGAAYMDAIFTYCREAGLKHPGSDNWPGWFYNSTPNGIGGYNNASQDTNSFANNPSLSAPQSDRNEGWDGQLILTPTDDLQLLFSFQKNNHTILSLGQFPTYPNQGIDRWAPWMFPNGQWGLSGYYKPNDQYSDEKDTSTFQYKGLIYPGAQGMDYPKWSWSAFVNYRCTALGFKNFRIGGGVVRTGPQEYQSGFTHGGDALKDEAGVPLILYTDPRWSVNMFARYEFKLDHERNAYVQLNVDNVLDDQHRYGFLYAPGRTFNFGMGVSF